MEANPNASLTDEQYALALAEFKKGQSPRPLTPPAAARKPKEKKETIVLTEDGEAMRLTEVKKPKIVGHIDLEGKQSQGCFPNITKYRLILELEKDFSEINIMGIDYTEYDGGQLIIDDKVGIVDKDLNIKIPFIYSGIYELDEYREKAIGKFYRVYLEGQGNGVYDKEYNEVLSPNYSNIYYVDDDRFIAMIFKSEVSSMNDNEIVLIDRDENILKKMNGFLEPVDTSSMKCCDDQMMYLLVGDDKLACYGIIDEELNVIIEAKYNSIYWMESEERYKVENKEGKIAFFDSDGNQLTEFTGQ